MIINFGNWREIKEDLIDPVILGGKAYSLVKMSNAGLNVPAGFVFTTDEFSNFKSLGAKYFFGFNKRRINKALSRLKEDVGETPLLSVRSGAPVSMPGMMDTILNLGIVSQWEKRSNVNGGVAFDCLIRFLKMYTETVARFDCVSVEQLKDMYSSHEEVLEGFNRIWRRNLGVSLPIDFSEQFKDCVASVFYSWNSKRAKSYRAINNIPEDMGTSVTIQQMVLGNKGNSSLSGVVFSRCPNTGTKNMVGDFIVDAQGEDVVSGTHATRPIKDLKKLISTEQYKEFCDGVKTIQAIFNEPLVDIEFTIEDGVLWWLQARRGKRSNIADWNIAKQFISTASPKTLIKGLSFMDDDSIKKGVVKTTITDNGTAPIKGIAAGGGAFIGEVAFRNQDCTGKIFVANETTPDDIDYMNQASAILTLVGGATSHAAIVARAMNKPCIVGLNDYCKSQSQNAGFSINGINLYAAVNGQVAAISNLAMHGDKGLVWLISEGMEISKYCAVDLRPFIECLINIDSKTKKHGVAVYDYELTEDLNLLEDCPVRIIPSTSDKSKFLEFVKIIAFNNKHDFWVYMKDFELDANGLDNQIYKSVFTNYNGTSESFRDQLFECGVGMEYDYIDVEDLPQHYSRVLLNYKNKY